MNPLLLTTSSIVIFSSTFASATSTARQIRNKRICRSCGTLAIEVSKRMEDTATNPRSVHVAARIGADGRPIAARKIDYMNSDARFMDVFTDICEKLDYSAKSGCYLITNEYEDQLKEWFQERKDESFLESFCFKELPDCNKAVHEASQSDIELENYEEDKDTIDDDFMPEAKEENVKAQEANFTEKAVEKVKNIRDNFLDIVEEVDGNVRKFLKKKIVDNKKIRIHADKVMKQEHYDLFLEHWYFVLLTALISMILPVIFVVMLQRYHKTEDSESSSSSKSRGKHAKKTKALKVPVVVVNESDASESEAAEADDEKSTAATRKSGRASRILSGEAKEATSPIKRVSKRNSKSQADD